MSAPLVHTLLNVAGIELEHTPEQKATARASFPERWYGTNGALTVDVRRFHSRFHAGDTAPEQADRWILEIRLTRSGQVWHECVHEARVYGLEAAKASAEAFIRDMVVAAKAVA